jgi:hypothetical protein
MMEPPPDAGIGRTHLARREPAAGRDCSIERRETSGRPNLGSLLIGYYDRGRLIYAGSVRREKPKE